MTARYIRDEPAIVDALALCDLGAPLSVAITVAANRAGIAPGRLRSSLDLWCALAGVPVPSDSDDCYGLLVALAGAHDVDTGCMGRSLVVSYGTPTQRDLALRRMREALRAMP